MKPVLAVWPLQRALLNLSSPASMLTPAHPIFVRLCLEAATYEPALAILDSDVYKLPLASGSLNSASSAAKLAASQQNTLTSSLTDRLRYVDHLEYHLYGAMIYMVYKKWERASQLLLYVVAAPAISDATSVIMVEAYKKWILVGLLHRGRVSLPVLQFDYMSVMKLLILTSFSLQSYRTPSTRARKEYIIFSQSHTI